jgi:flagellar biosynthesis protein FlhA
MPAPTIRTKGKNEFARRILRLAKKNKIPVIHNNELTRKLYSHASKDDLLPEDFYESIAKIYIELRRGKPEPKRKNTNAGKTGSAKNDKIRNMDVPAVYIPDKLLLEIGEDLIPLVTNSLSPLGERIKNTRKLFLSEMGFRLPRIRIVDNLLLKKNEYCIKVNGTEAGRACINMYLAINSENSPEKIAGQTTPDPVFGSMALWIYESEIEKAKKAGFLIVDPVAVIVTHISEICKKFSKELVGLDEICKFIDCVKEDYPALVNDMLKYYSAVDIKKVIHGLLAEQVSIKNITTIFETLSDYGEKFSHNHAFLIEKVRQKLGRQICAHYIDRGNKLRVLLLEPDIEKKIIEHGLETPDGMVSRLDPVDHKLWIDALSEKYNKIIKADFTPVVLCSEAARRLVKDSTKRAFPYLDVLSALEIPEDITIKLAGTISLGIARRPASEK